MRKSSRNSAKVSSGERRYADCRNGLGIEAICWRLVRKEQKKKKYHSLIDKVRNWRNLNDAWDKVKQKPDGKQRPLGIPTIRDRVVQQALKNVIEPIFEAEFLDSSFEYRPGKSAKQAMVES
ncbi:MAG: hypothetical protein WAV32_05130 [Halobacteriota archaeon]